MNKKCCSLTVVCLRLCLIVATWFQFSKWPVLLPDVNTPVTLLLQRAHFYRAKPKHAATHHISDEALVFSGWITDPNVFEEVK